MIDTARVVEVAKSFWDPEDNRSTFEEDLAFHLQAPGAVVHKVGGLLFARPVKYNEPEKWETYTVYPREECDAWYVWLAVGEARQFAKLLRYFLPPLKYVIRKKKDVFHVVSSEKLLQLI